MTQIPCIKPTILTIGASLGRTACTITLSCQILRQDLRNMQFGCIQLRKG